MIGCRRPWKSRRICVSATSRPCSRRRDFTFADTVRINAFVVGREHLKGYMSVRDLYIGDPPPASTLMIVSGFSRPEFLVEIEIIAAAPG